METKRIKLTELDANTGQIEGLAANPRRWTKDEFEALKASIIETPELLEARGAIVYPCKGRFVVLGGNMRLAAVKSLGWQEMPCVLLPGDTSVEKLKEIVIKDNDSFGGGGTTMIACEQLGRRCRMMELDPHYCDVIIDRWEKLTGKKAEKIK